MRVTMKDVAKKANVSQPTVSRVLNGNIKVDRKIKDRVDKAIKELGYIPNTVAKNLKINKTNLIGVCLTDISNPYFAELLRNIEKEANKKGYDIIFNCSDVNPINEIKILENYKKRRVDGCLLVPSSEYTLQKAKDFFSPLVIITQSHKGFDSVAISHFKAGQKVAEHFINSGHKKFCFIGNEEDDKYRGFLSGVYENGFSPDNVVLFKTCSDYIDTLSVKNFIEEKIKENFDFTAVFTQNDLIALEFIKYINSYYKEKANIVSVVGFDNTILAKHLDISSIRQPLKSVSEAALTILFDRINGNKTNKSLNIEFESKLIVRGSSKKIE